MSHLRTSHQKLWVFLVNEVLTKICRFSKNFFLESPVENFGFCSRIIQGLLKEKKIKINISRTSYELFGRKFWIF